MIRLVATLAALALAAPAAAKNVAGHPFPDAVEVGGQKLALNGAGIRKRFVVKVYAAALYLAAPSADADAIVASDAPKVVRMVFLRGVTRDQVMGAFRDGFQANSGGPGLPALLATLDKIVPAIPDRFVEGNELVVSWAPGQGTTVKGSGAVTVPGKEFADALFRNWLGPKPADADLKQGLLGR